jgi:hypothetical protein
MGKRTKKTIEVGSIIDFVNKQLSLPQSDIVTIDYKHGLISVLEHTLRETGRYYGFMFIDYNNCEFNTFGYVTRKYFDK